MTKNRKVLKRVLWTLGILLVLGLLGTVIAIQYTKAKFRDYTSDVAVAVPARDVPDEEYTSLQKRLEEIGTAFRRNEASEIVLTPGDLNALVARQPQVKGRIFYEIQNDTLYVQMSLPMGYINPAMAGRFFNGKVGLKAHIEDGSLKQFEVVSIESNDASVQDDVAVSMVRNFLESMVERNYSKNEMARYELSKVKLLAVQENEIRIVTQTTSMERPVPPARNAGRVRPRRQVPLTTYFFYGGGAVLLVGLVVYGIQRFRNRV